MKILVNGDLILHQELFKSLQMDVTSYDNNMSIITLPENAKIHTNIVSNDNLPQHTHEQQLSEYVALNDTSLKDFITVKSRIIASGDFQEIDKNLELPYDYIVNSDFRLFRDDNAKVRTSDYILSGQIEVEEYYHYLEYMLRNSTVISATSKNKTR